MDLTTARRSKKDSNGFTSSKIEGNKVEGNEESKKFYENLKSARVINIHAELINCDLVWLKSVQLR